MAEYDRAELAPADGDAERAGQLGFAPEHTQHARAQPGVHRAEEQGHYAERGVAVPVGHGPRRLAGAEPRGRLVGFGVARHVGGRRGVRQEDHGGPPEPLPAAGHVAPALVRGGVPVNGGLFRALEDDPGRTTGVAGRGRPECGVQEAVDERRVDRFGREATHHGAAPDGVVELHGPQSSRRPQDTGEC